MFYLSVFPLLTQIFIAMGLLFWVVSYAMLAGLGMIVLVLVINNIIAKKTKIATDKWVFLLYYIPSYH